MRTIIACAVALVALALPVIAAAAVQPGDKLNVVVYNHPELSAQPTVDASGNVSLPLVGAVNAGYSDPSVVAGRVRDKLLPYVKHAAVDVQVLAQSTSLFVTGGPGGVVAYAPGETLTGAVQSALLKTATSGSNGVPLTVSSTSLDPFRSPIDLRSVRVERDGSTLGNYNVEALLKSGQGGIAMQPGDTIGLAYKPVTVTVTGQVKDAGVAHLQENEPLSDALLQVGGIDETTAGYGFILNRGDQRQPVTSTSPAYSAPAQNGDLIIVPPAIHVAVTGDVTKPGDISLRGDPSLLSALYLAGGPDAVGDLKNVHIVHDGRSTSYDVTAATHGVPSSVTTLADGDTIYVPANPRHVDYRGIFQTIVSAALFFVRF